MKPRSILSLDELAAHPERVGELAADTVRHLYVRVATLKVALWANLPPSIPAVSPASRDGDRLLGPAEVAARICKSRSWVEKHANELPPRRRVGGEGLWSEREIDVWIRTRPRWGEV